MMPYKAVVHIYKNPSAPAPDQTIEFAFVSGAREYARSQVEAGKAKKAVVAGPDGKVIETFPG